MVVLWSRLRLEMSKPPRPNLQRHWQRSHGDDCPIYAVRQLSGRYSSWPRGDDGGQPRSAVIVITNDDGGEIGVIVVL